MKKPVQSANMQELLNTSLDELVPLYSSKRRNNTPHPVPAAQKHRRFNKIASYRHQQPPTHKKQLPVKKKQHATTERRVESGKPIHNRFDGRSNNTTFTKKKRLTVAAHDEGYVADAADPRELVDEEDNDDCLYDEMYDGDGNKKKGGRNSCYDSDVLFVDGNTGNINFGLVGENESPRTYLKKVGAAIRSCLRQGVV